MAKEKSEERKKEKKDKKRSESDGVSKPSKKDKKEKKASEATLTKALSEHLETVADITGDGDQPIAAVDVAGAGVKPLLAALVPFANPLADEKVGKKVLKGVKKCKLRPV